MEEGQLDAVQGDLETLRQRLAAMRAAGDEQSEIAAAVARDLHAILDRLKEKKTEREATLAALKRQSGPRPPV